MFSLLVSETIPLRQSADKNQVSEQYPSVAFGPANELHIDPNMSENRSLAYFLLED
jgi:hypothetical protein